jgi:polyvinyl alcohol dehydrogenase (cytochrome)
VRIRVCAALVASGLAASLLVVAPSAHAASCAAPTTSGGDWTTYGHDLANSRLQPDEHVIGTGNVANVTKKWSFTAVDDLGGGAITSTPIVSDGCVFVTSSVTNAAMLFALNADDGSLVWSQKFGGDGLTLVGGAAVGSPVVSNGRVFMLVSQPDHPYAVAFDAFTGTQLWGGGANKLPSTADGYIDDSPSAFINASALVIPSANGDMLFAGFSSYEASPVGRGGWTIFDGATGAVLSHEYSVSDADFANGERGASLWATAAADVATGFVYAPTGNPSSSKPEARNADSILKIDVRRASPTFGKMLASYHGDPESYVGALQKQPVCDAQPEVRYLSWSATCAQLDLDFGASPNLFHNALGQPLVGALQKSGVFHAAYADTMGGAWTTVMGLPGVAFNAASTATDGSASIYGVGTPGGVLQSLSTGDGRLQWAQPVADGVHYQSISLANGVTYATDGWGFLNAWDSATGLPLLKHNIGDDTGNTQEANQGSGGVAIARNRLFVGNNLDVVAYGL